MRNTLIKNLSWHSKAPIYRDVIMSNALPPSYLTLIIAIDFSSCGSRAIWVRERSKIRKLNRSASSIKDFTAIAKLQGVPFKFICLHNFRIWQFQIQGSSSLSKAKGNSKANKGGSKGKGKGKDNRNQSSQPMGRALEWCAYKWYETFTHMQRHRRLGPSPSAGPALSCERRTMAPVPTI